MKRLASSFILLLPAAIAAGTAQAAQTEQAAQTAEDWQQSAMIYIWLPSVGGTTRYQVPPNRGTSVDIDANAILDSLEGTFMGTYQARHGKWSLLVDFIYLDLGNTKSSSVSFGPNRDWTVSSQVNMNFRGFTSTAAAAYNLLDEGGNTLDLLGGVRVFSYDANTSLSFAGPLPATLPPASLSQSETLWDGVIGAKGEVSLGGNWSIPYYLDVGTGDSTLTWQAMAGVARRTDWGDVMLAYRHLAYDQGNDKFLQNFSFSGPALGVRFRF